MTAIQRTQPTTPAATPSTDQTNAGSDVLGRMAREPCNYFVLRTPNEVSVHFLSRDGGKVSSHVMKPDDPVAQRALDHARRHDGRIYEHAKPMPEPAPTASPAEAERTRMEAGIIRQIYMHNFQQEGASCPVSSLPRPTTVAGVATRRMLT